MRTVISLACFKSASLALKRAKLITITTGEPQVEHNPSQLPMILWQYELVTIEQLDRIYDWMEGS
jgi:Protein of unknown function (DUF2949)